MTAQDSGVLWERAEIVLFSGGPLKPNQLAARMQGPEGTMFIRDPERKGIWVDSYNRPGAGGAEPRHEPALGSGLGAKWPGPQLVGGAVQTRVPRPEESFWLSVIP